MASNFMYLNFFNLPYSSLWRIETVFWLFEKVGIVTRNHNNILKKPLCSR